MFNTHGLYSVCDSYGRVYFVIQLCNRYIPFLVGKKVVKKVLPQEVNVTF